MLSFAEGKENQIDVSPPLDLFNEWLEIHHHPDTSSSNISTETTIDYEAPTSYRNLNEIYSSFSFTLIAADPMTFEDAKMSSDWMAMNEEIEAIHKNQTWELAILPEVKKVIGLKRVFKSKFKPNGTLLRKKARIVAKGYTQWEGEDFEEIFSPIALMETIWLFMAIGT